jgi:hypothetical protein
MDEEYHQVLGLLKDYLDGKMDFKSLIKKTKRDRGRLRTTVPAEEPY